MNALSLSCAPSPIGKYESDYYGIIVLPTLLRPKSRGTIKLRSANWWDYPVIDNFYLTHPHDVSTVMEGLKYAYDLKVSIPSFHCQS